MNTRRKMGRLFSRHRGNWRNYTRIRRPIPWGMLFEVTWEMWHDTKYDLDEGA